MINIIKKLLYNTYLYKIYILYIIKNIKIVLQFLLIYHIKIIYFSLLKSII